MCSWSSVLKVLSVLRPYPTLLAWQNQENSFEDPDLGEVPFINCDYYDQDNDAVRPDLITYALVSLMGSLVMFVEDWIP
jgi:hypothetical protein